MAVDVVALRGGLGNQLFGWARGASLAAAGRRVIFDRGSIHGREYGLHGLLEQVGTSIAIPVRAWRVIQRLPKSTPGISVNVEDQSLSPEFNAPRGATLEFHWGYWQSLDYFVSCRSALTERIVDWLELSGVESDVTAIHVRRGDYVSDPAAAATIGTLGVEYYQRAVDDALNSARKVVIVTDDAAWARSTFGDQRVSIEASNDPMCDFRTLASAGQVVTSNSSFSWWAALISESRGGTITAPREWFKDARLNSSRIVPDGWVRK